MSVYKIKDLSSSNSAEANKNFWENAQVMMPEDNPKVQVTARFDEDVVDWFQQQGRGYQARMNAVLRAYYKTFKDR